MGCKLKKYSYISFETVLKKAGVIFQDHGDSVYLASDDTLKKKVDGQQYIYRKVKNAILLDPLWVDHRGIYTIASLERALCDILYVNTDYYFDNLEPISWKGAREIARMYPKSVQKRIDKLSHEAQ